MKRSTEQFYQNKARKMQVNMKIWQSNSWVAFSTALLLNKQ